MRAQQHLNPSIQMCLNLPGLLGYVAEYIPFCCYCVSKSSCLELKMLTNRQSFQKIFLYVDYPVAILGLPTGCIHYFLGLGASCGLLCAWRSLIPVDPVIFSLFLPLFHTQSLLVLPSIHYPRGWLHTGRCQLLHEWNIREIGSL